MEQMELSISGENHTIQAGTRNLIIRSDAPIDVCQNSDDDDDDDEGWTEVPQRGGQPGVPQLPHAVHSAPDVDISGSGHSVQTGKTCLQMSAGADPHQVSQIAAIRFSTGDGNFPHKIKISGQKHDIQQGETCIKVVSPPAISDQMQSPLSQAKTSSTGATASSEPRTEGVEEGDGEANDLVQSQHVLHDAHPLPPPLSSLEADVRGDQTDLKTASTPQLSFPHQESATGAQGQGDKQGKWQLLAADQRSALEAKPQRGAKTTNDAAEKPDMADPTEGSQREVDMKHNATDFARRPEPLEDDEISNMSGSECDVSVSRIQPNPTAVSNTTSVSVDKTGSYTTGSKPTCGHNEISIDSSCPDDSLDRTLRAVAAKPVETSAPLSQSQQSDRSTTRTLTSSDADVASSLQKTEVSTGALAIKSSTSVEESQLDWRTRGKVDEGDSGKRKEIQSSVPVGSTFAKKSTYARSHSLDKQPRDGVGFAEHQLASFYSSQTAAVAAELSSGFTENEISNDAIYEIQSDLVPQKKKLSYPERERKAKNTKPSGVTAVNANDSQDVEIKEQSLEDLTHHENWGHQFSDDDDDVVDYSIENRGISKAMPHESPPSPLGIDPHFRSIDVFQSNDVLNSLSASASLHSSLVDRVNRMEQVLDDMKKMALESQRTLESRLDKLQGMVEELLQMVAAQKKDTPTTPSGSAPSSLQGDVHNEASGGEHALDMEQPLERTDSSPEPNKTRSTSHKGKTADRELSFEEEPPSDRQHGKAGKTRKVQFLSPDEALPPLRTMETFKGDAYVRPKQRPSTSRHEEDVDMGRRGTKGVHTETTKGKNGVPAETRETCGDTRNPRKKEAGTAGQDGGIRVYAGGLRQDSGGRGGTTTDEVELEDDLDVSTRPKKPARKESSRPLHPPSPPPVEEVEEDLTMKSKVVIFSPVTLMILKNLRIIYSISDLSTDPVAFRLATALQRAIHPGIKSMPPRAMGQCTILVLDNSESMKGKPLQQALKFASDFIDDIEDIAEKHSREENVALITMGGGAKVIHHLTNDYNSLRGALERVRAEGRSPMFEATLVCFGIAYAHHTTVHVANALTVRPRAIFITDGKITDESQTHGPDTPSTEPEVRRELVRLLYSMKSAPVYPRPIIWVPAGDVDTAFMDAMANISGHLVAETGAVDYLANNFRLQIITGKILSCMLDMPQPPVDIMESIRSHIEIFQPDLSEDYKKIVVSRVFNNLTQRMASTFLRTFGLDEKTRGQRPDRQTGGTTAPKEGHSKPHTIRGQRKVAR